MIEHHSYKIQNVIQKELFNAKQSIKIVVAWFTNDLLFQPLVLKQGAGVQVEIILNRDEINCSNENNVNFNELVNAGGIVRWNDTKQLMHDKFCIIDDSIVIYGSYNWTNKAEYNEESITIARDEFETTKFYIDNFNRLSKKFSNEIVVNNRNVSNEQRHTNSIQVKVTDEKDRLSSRKPLKLSSYIKLDFYSKINILEQNGGSSLVAEMDKISFLINDLGSKDATINERLQLERRKLLSYGWISGIEALSGKHIPCDFFNPQLLYSNNDNNFKTGDELYIGDDINNVFLERSNTMNVLHVLTICKTTLNVGEKDVQPFYYPKIISFNILDYSLNGYNLKTYGYIRENQPQELFTSRTSNIHDVYDRISNCSTEKEVWETIKNKCIKIVDVHEILPENYTERSKKVFLPVLSFVENRLNNLDLSNPQYNIRDYKIDSYFFRNNLGYKYLHGIINRKTGIWVVNQEFDHIDWVIGIYRSFVKFIKDDYEAMCPIEDLEYLRYYGQRD